MRSDVDVAVARLASKQYGVFSYLQALTCGAIPMLVSRRVGSSLWERVAPAVYRLPGYPASWEQDLMIAVLDAGEDAVVSHRAAALL